MATLKFNNINKIYDNNVQAVFDFNLDVQDKEFIVFVGPSGCGKSTTLRMVAGLEDITYGELYIDGKLVNEVLPKDRDIAMVFQNYALFPHMTVYKNISFSLRMRKFPVPVFDKEGKPIIVVDKASIKKYKTLLKQEKDELQDLKLQLDNLNNPKEVIEKTEEELQKEIKEREDKVFELNEKIENLKANPSAQKMRMVKMSKDEIDRRVQNTAEILELTEYLYRKPAALSGGQRQRVALGRAIVRNPKVFLMDEPLSNLDAKLRVQMRSEIIRIHKRVSATTIYVTHDQTEAMTMADRIVVMKSGYIQQIGKPEEVYNNPANMFVAGFIGSPAMNFLTGKLDGGKFVVAGDSKFTIGLTKAHLDLLKEYKDGKELVLGVRPEHCHSYKKDDVQLTNSVSAKCNLSELLGSDIIAYTDLDGQKLSVKTNDKYPVKTNENFEVYFESEKLYFFDKESGLRIAKEAK